MLKNLKVKTKMLGAFIVVVLITITIGVIGGINLNVLKESNVHLYQETVVLSQISKINVDFQRNRRFIAMMAQEVDLAKVAKYKEDVMKVSSEIGNMTVEFEKNTFSPEVKTLIDEWIVTRKVYIEKRDNLFKLIEAKQKALVWAQLADDTEYGKVAKEYSDDLIKIETKLVDESKVNAQENTDKANSTILFMLIAVALGSIVAISIGFVMSNAISTPIHKIKELMAQAETGDLTVRADESSKDELGELAKSFNSLLEKTSNAMKNIWNTTQALNKSSNSMLNISGTMAASSEETSSKTAVVSSAVEQISAGMSQTSVSLSSTSSNINTIASAVEEMSGTIRGLAAASEQTSAGVKNASNLVEDITGSIGNVSKSANEVSTAVNNVVTAVKEINVSLNEVSKNCSKSMQITADAEVRAVDTNSIIEKLNSSSKQIGKIVSVINDIADQTNMLALNAAIEAAGAGEAGKGFAVVANEVKELAKQTAEATDEISQQIESMQSNMSQAVGAVSSITEVIKEITGITNTIAAAVTEQSATTSEISNAAVRAAERVSIITNDIGDVSGNAKNVARSVEESTKGVLDIARSAAELSKASGDVAMSSERASASLNEITRNTQEISKGSVEISRNVQEINSAANEVARGASETSSSAKYLSDVAIELEGMVRQFKV